jgi:uncharacterized phage protein (TIGR01671 family)
VREIKFRVWDKLYKIMREVLSIDFEKQKVICPPRGHEFSEWYNQHLSFNEVLLMQYTGLKDKNGKEIYEGDIVETVTASGNPFGTIDVVRCQDGGFKLVDETDSLLPIYIGDKEVISIEVIGNIYENPELIEGE